MPYLSSLTASGVMGDATKVTVKKGRKLLEAGIEGLVKLARELKETPIPLRPDQHDDHGQRNTAWT